MTIELSYYAILRDHDRTRLSSTSPGTLKPICDEDVPYGGLWRV